jgi:hypothetical protein
MVIGLIIWIFALAFVLAYNAYCNIQVEHDDASSFEELFAKSYISTPITLLVAFIGLLNYTDYYKTGTASFSDEILIRIVILISTGFTSFLMRYVKELPTGLNKYLHMKMPEPLAQSLPDAEPDFHDDEVERLLYDGKLSAARKRIVEMISIAKEEKDRRVLGNYHKYELLLHGAELNGRRRVRGR